MAATQTSVSQRPAKALEGQISDDAPRYMRSMVNAGSGDIGFGRMVVYEDDEGNQADLLDGASDILAGVVVHGHAYNIDHELSDDDELKPGTVMDVMKFGVVTVFPEEAVDPTDDVRVRHSGTGKIGGFRASAEAGETLDISSFARWLTKAGAGEPAELFINMAGAAGADADT